MECELGGGIHHLSVNIKLQLIAGSVSDAYRPRAAIAPENVRLALLGRRIPVKRIKNSQFRLCEPRGMQHPIQETGSLRPKPKLNQRAYGKRCVPQPAVAVVPIKVSADTFGQGSGGSGNDRARGSKNHELQRECASHDLIAKLSFILAPRRPALPPLSASIDALRDLLQRWQHRRRIL